MAWKEESPAGPEVVGFLGWWLGFGVDGGLGEININYII